MDEGRKGDTWPKVLRFNYEKYGISRKAMRYKHYGIWLAYTWKDYYLDVKYLTLGLSALGFVPGDTLLIVGDNAPQWYGAELAAQAGHGASLGVDPDLTPAEIAHIAESGRARFAVVQDQEQVDKLLEVRSRLPRLLKIIYWTYKGLAHYDDDMLMGYGEVLELGKSYEAEHPGLFEKNVEIGKADDVCALVCTSGTTGSPRTAVHTHGTIRAGADHLLRLHPWKEHDNVVPLLPPAWITGQWSAVGCHLLSGCTLNFAEEPETAQRDTREIGPTIAWHGARLWERQAAGLQARISDVDALTRLVFRVLMPIGYRMADLRREGKEPHRVLKLLFTLADAVLFRRIRATLGLQDARICYSTGALLSPEAARLYHTLGVPLKSLYFTTEGGVLTNVAANGFPGQTGSSPEDGSGVRITDAGEIVSRSPGMFAGYYEDPQATAAALKDGWFHSGDRGLIGDDGAVHFLDRTGSVVALSTGDTLAPQAVESRLRFSPYIRDAWVLAGPQSAYASAVIVIDYRTVSKWAGQRKIAHRTCAELCQRPEVYALVGREIDRVNRSLPPGGRVKRYVHLHREFDPDEGELTRTGNLRRAVLEERYRGIIDAIYAGKAEAAVVDAGRQDDRVEARETRVAIASAGETTS
jgi:long-chain acyl-CoA synthetase